MISNYLSNQLTEERKQSAYEALDECINDSDIQYFFQQYNLTDDEEFIKRNSTRIMEYVINRDKNPYFYPTMQLINNTLHLTYIPKTEAQRFRMSNGENSIPKVYYDEITKNFKNAELDTKLLTTNDLSVLKEMKAFIDNYQRNTLNKGIWLYGSYGVGKTFLMSYFSKELVKQGIEVRFISFSNFMDKLMTKIKTNGDNLEKEVSKLSKVEVLILDDMGAEYIKLFGIGILYRILDYRMNNKKATFFTSNYNIHDYLESLNNVDGFNHHEKGRLNERMTFLSKQVQLVGKNRRNK